MTRNYKTSEKNRVNYIYYGVDGNRTVLRPGVNGVTEAIIETLHGLDDEYYDIDRSETRRHESINELGDKASNIKDSNIDVEEAVIAAMDADEAKKILQEIMPKLKPDQQDLIRRLYLSDKPISQADYAKELGIEESSVTQKAWRIRNKIKKLIENKNLL